MGAIEQVSLAAAVDEVNEASFFGRSLTLAKRRSLAKWIAGRRGLPGSYAGMPAPTEQDFREGIRLFTGERMSTRGGTAHVLGEEACRALILLNVTDRSLQSALERAIEGIVVCLEKSRLREANMGRKWRGEYCCATCTCAVWRHASVGGLHAIRPEQWLAAGIRSLRAYRTSNGRWRRFPFFYTLLALSEIDSRDAMEELRYTAPSCERVVRGASIADDVFARRRRALAERVLGKV